MEQFPHNNGGWRRRRTEHKKCGGNGESIESHTWICNRIKDTASGDGELDAKIRTDNKNFKCGEEDREELKKDVR